MADNKATIGITHYAQVSPVCVLPCVYVCRPLQDKLGDVVYAELPEVGLELEVEGMFIVIVSNGRY